MCDWCGRPATLTPVEGEGLCPRCVDAYLDGKVAEGIRVMIDGREAVLRPGYVTPRARRF